MPGQVAQRSSRRSACRSRLAAVLGEAVYLRLSSSSLPAKSSSTSVGGSIVGRSATAAPRTYGSRCAAASTCARLYPTL